MSERKLGKTIFGAIIGLILGIFLGANRVMEVVSEASGSAGVPGQQGGVGWDINVLLRSPHFWIIVVICTLVFAFISGRIGRPTQQSDL